MRPAVGSAIARSPTSSGDWNSPVGATRMPPRQVIHPAGIDDQVLRLKRLHHLFRGQSQRGKLRRGDVDVDPFILHSPEVDPGHARHNAQLLAHVLDVALQFGIVVPVAADGQEKAEYIAEIVADLRFAGAGRQRAFHVPHLLAQHVPHLRELVGPVVALDVDLDDRQTGAGIGVDVLQLRHLLELGFNLVGDFQFDLPGAGAGIGGRDDGGLHRELRVFQLAELEVAEHAAGHDQKYSEVDDRPLFNRDRGKVHGVTNFLPGVSSPVGRPGANARRR